MGCAVGIPAGIVVEAPVIVVTTGLTAIGANLWENFAANQELRTDLAACAKIP